MKRLAFFLLVAIMATSPAFGQAAVEAVDASSKTITHAGAAAQRQWLAASLEQRIRLAEDIGERGARAVAKERGLQPIMDGVGKTLPQGPDQVYRAADDVIHVFEAKGGSSQLGRAYGHLQGTPEWAVESAKRVLRSNRATLMERQAAKAILEAAAKGKLEVHVVRTSHVLGERTATAVEQSLSWTDDAAKLAQSALDDFARAGGQVADDTARAVANMADDAARAGGSTVDDLARAGTDLTDDVARASRGTSRIGRLTRGAGKVAIPVAVAVDAGFRASDAMESEARFQSGQISEQEREVQHARNAAGMAGGWGGALALGKAGALAGSAFGPWGSALGGLGGGIAGYFGGEAAAEAGAEWGVQQVHAAGASVADIVQGVWDGTKDAAAWTADTACQAGQAVSSSASAAWDGTKDAAAWTADKACEAGQAVSSGASAAWGGTKSAGRWVGGSATDAWNWAFGD